MRAIIRTPVRLRTSPIAEAMPESHDHQYCMGVGVTGAVCGGFFLLIERFHYI